MTELREGKVRKGGRNKAPTPEMLANRPKPPAQMSASCEPAFEAVNKSVQSFHPLPYPALQYSNRDKRYMIPDGSYLAPDGRNCLQFVLPSGQALDWYCTEDFGENIDRRAKLIQEHKMRDSWPIHMRNDDDVTVKIGNEWLLCWDVHEGVIFKNQLHGIQFGVGTRHARELFNLLANMILQTTWLDIEDLDAGKKVLLRFDDLVEQRWVGYVDCWGVCQYPPAVAGKKPSAFANLPDDVR